MEEARYLIDTNAIIDYLARKFPAGSMDFMNQLIDASATVSVITKIELLSFNAPREHYQLLTEFMNDATVLALTSKIVDASIDIRRKYKTKLPDAIIAATALVYNLTLVSHNTADFKNIQGLQVIDPHGLSSKNFEAPEL